jgi:L-threonylcarbamoyladenylate synthase
MEVDGSIHLTFGDSLSYAHLKQLCYILRFGGVCIIPSDTTYSLAALPFRRDTITKLGKLLDRKNKDPIPLAFGSLNLVEQYVTLTTKDQKLIDKYFPGPLTLVCKISHKQMLNKAQLEDALNTTGTIGVRIPDSPVERQISVELQRPITTCAIRDEDGTPIRNFDDAVSIVRTRMEVLEEKGPLFAVRMTRIKYHDVSTVATTDNSVVPAPNKLVAPYSIYIYRPGLIEPEKLEETARQLSYYDVEDGT